MNLGWLLAALARIDRAGRARGARRRLTLTNRAAHGGVAAHQSTRHGALAREGTFSVRAGNPALARAVATDGHAAVCNQVAGAAAGAREHASVLRLQITSRAALAG